MTIIIKSNNKKAPNWAGKGFSHAPAKVYTDFQSAAEALSSYHFHRWKDSKGFVDKTETELMGTIRFVFLHHKQAEKLLQAGKIRY